MIRIIRIMQHIPVVVISEHLESAEIVALYHTGILAQALHLQQNHGGQHDLPHVVSFNGELAPGAV